MSKKSVFLLEDIGLSRADTESVVRAAVFPSPFYALEEKVAGGRSDESPVGDPEGPFEGGDVCETEAGTEADVEDDDVDAVSDADDVGVSRYESEGFTLTELLARESVSEGVVDTAHLPQGEFWNLQRLPLTFPLEILCWPAIEFC